MSTSRVWFVALTAAAALAGVATAKLPGKGEVITVSLGPTEALVTRDSGSSASGFRASENARLVVLGTSDDLVLQDTNLTGDIYLRDVKNDTTFLGSAGSDGLAGDGGSFNADVSGNSKILAFRSRAENLDPADDNEAEDIFVRDLVRGTTERVSIGPAGEQGDGDSFSPSISKNGRMVAFMSLSQNFHAPEGNSSWDVFVRDRKKGKTTLVSIATGGSTGNNNSEDPAISGNGKFVLFWSRATDLVEGGVTGTQLYVRDLKKRTTTLLTVAAAGGASTGSAERGSLSKNGRWAVFTSDGDDLVGNDTNGRRDVFVRDLKKRITTRVSVGFDGREVVDGASGGLISSNGRHVAFGSEGTEFDAGAAFLEGIFVRDLKKATTTSAALGESLEVVALVKKGKILVWNDETEDQVPTTFMTRR